jgi:iron complex outermembrane recepter protein
MAVRSLRLLTLLLALLGVSTLVQAQATTRVVGVATDISGAVVQAAKIEIKNLESDLVRTGASDDQGRFAFDGLPPGRYRVLAAAPGLDAAVRTVTAGAGQETRADLVLAVARQEAAVVVTVAPTSRPLVVETDPRAPQQPVPAHDGADYLKAIPGFSVVRKGGTDGDPILRGMAGSRLGILVDGQQIYGGCGGRMDPPTAYVFPSAYDRITVFKGPETVLQAAGTSAGVVLFERDIRRVDVPAVKSMGAVTAGAFGRHDEMADVRASLPSVYVQAVGTRSHTDDYKDGSGSAVHSFYTRWSGSAAVGWTPDHDTRLEVSGIASDGEAAYADRGMDGTKFARQNVAIKFDRHMSGSVVSRVEAQSYYNYIDHVMDNYSLRTPGTLFSVNNPDRRTIGGRAAVTLALDNATSLVLGADTQGNVHRLRGASGKTSAEAATSAYTSAPRAEDMRFRQVGAFGEATRVISGASRLIGGVRTDWHNAVDSRACLSGSMCPGDSPLKNDTLGATDRKTLVSAFGRYELGVTAGGAGTVYVGLGHAERFPDYWERKNLDQTTLKSVFLTARPERTTQLDTGVLWKAAGWSGSVSAFYGKIRDYLLIRWSPAPTLTRNVDATTLGGEADLSRTVARNLKADVTLAYVRSQNDTDGKPLAQQPPAETRIGLQYDNHVFSLGALARVVAAQNRVDVGSGNIVANGKDIGPTAGFSVFSVNGGYRFGAGISLTGGIDNVLDRTYAEHVSQAGAMVPGFVQTVRINEPGRTAWVKLNVSVD